ncbi:N-acetyltransferase [Gilliamella sp. B2776]|uniref:GNAT family N-acetyltransferase n=1 Tax=unclassified Gilliamella TaxID=2685620 RepID=UPI00226A1B87|nr:MULTISPECIES: GNAT family N-acetyltransferase [unclassified Gilliamella]MCX8649717.1 N-acetyltransferase [Gilliamella sp. B2779]MCX8653772.1 N-acetyltransferase [Gilliamella sp. B2737]MCX8656037.1 N-acetyltransferase [Gilliamella sp. B2894]MCX8664655.1 N-acetyltransferase [Gilliamella sp. B2887]MCX8691490.1 N-acetyltransferase [Gilliamella sp. B2776]
MSLSYLEDIDRFYVCDAKHQQIAEMTFTRLGQNQATINHTYIAPDYRGQGIAEKLLDLVVKKLQQENRKIIPICSFAIKKLNEQN